MRALYQPADIARNWWGEHSETAIRGKGAICRRRDVLHSQVQFFST